MKSKVFASLALALTCASTAIPAFAKDYDNDAKRVLPKKGSVVVVEPDGKDFQVFMPWQKDPAALKELEQFKKDHPSVTTGSVVVANPDGSSRVIPRAIVRERSWVEKAMAAAKALFTPSKQMDGAPETYTVNPGARSSAAAQLNK